MGPTETLPIANRVTGDLTLPLVDSRPGTLNLATRRLDLGPLAQPVLPPHLAGCGCCRCRPARSRSAPAPTS